MKWLEKISRKYEKKLWEPLTINHIGEINPNLAIPMVWLRQEIDIFSPVDSALLWPMSSMKSKAWGPNDPRVSIPIGIIRIKVKTNLMEINPQKYENQAEMNRWPQYL